MPPDTLRAMKPLAFSIAALLSFNPSPVIAQTEIVVEAGNFDRRETVVRFHGAERIRRHGE